MTYNYFSLHILTYACLKIVPSHFAALGFLPPDMTVKPHQILSNVRNPLKLYIILHITLNKEKNILKTFYYIAKYENWRESNHLEINSQNYNKE